MNQISPGLGDNESNGYICEYRLFVGEEPVRPYRIILRHEQKTRNCNENFQGIKFQVIRKRRS